MAGWLVALALLLTPHHDAPDHPRHFVLDNWPAAAAAPAATPGPAPTVGPDAPAEPDVPPAPPLPPAPDHGLAELQALVALYDWPQDGAIATAWCESRYHSNAVGHEVYQGRDLYFYGWFQTLYGSAEPEANVAEAHRQWASWQRGERENPWPGCWL